MPVRLFRTRPRLLASAVAGFLAAVAVPGGVRLPHVLIGWDSGVVVYLVLIAILFFRSSTDDIRERARRNDEGRATILVLTGAAALASLGAILAVLSPTEPGAPVSRLALILAAVTIVLSWTFTHVVFAAHYAYEFYDEEDGGGLSFPEGSEEPDYLDFLYFSLVIGMTSQVSDVSVTARPIRRTVTAHGVLAFFFNVTLVALLVNLAASAAGGNGG
jgi:uncharacterized membrane protein